MKKTIATLTLAIFALTTSAVFAAQPAKPADTKTDTKKTEAPATKTTAKKGHKKGEAKKTDTATTTATPAPVKKN